MLHMFPLTLPEVVPTKKFSINSLQTIDLEKLANLSFDASASNDALDAFLNFSGFPEPFTKHSARSYRLWSKEYFEPLIKEDLRDLSRVTDILRVEQTIELLETRIGSPLSLNSLREDLQCSHDAVKAVIMALEKLYLIVSIRPWSKHVKNSLRKERKVYFLDWCRCQSEGARFENFVAIQLMTFLQTVSDSGLGTGELTYLRDKQKNEVDFLLIFNKKPFLLVEAKTTEQQPSKSIFHFAEQFPNTPAIQIVRTPNVFKKSDSILVTSADRLIYYLWSLFSGK